MLAINALADEAPAKKADIVPEPDYVVQAGMSQISQERTLLIAAVEIAWIS